MEPRWLSLNKKKRAWEIWSAKEKPSCVLWPGKGRYDAREETVTENTSWLGSRKGKQDVEEGL